MFLENKERGLAQNKKVMQQLQSRSGAGGMAGSGAGAGMGGGMGRWAADAGFEDENDSEYNVSRRDRALGPADSRPSFLISRSFCSRLFLISGVGPVQPPFFLCICR